MALTFNDFETYPIEIIGITAYYNARIAAIETFVLSDLEYSGESSDLSTILPYFVFWYFCQDATTTVFVETGENSQVKEFTQPEIFKQVQAWNLGVKRLQTLIDANEETVNEYYLSKRSLL
jgi:hypothetical protein